MKKYWKVVGITALTAGALYYPLMRLYKYWKSQKAEDKGEEPKHVVKAFSPAYRGEHKPHHRHQNGKDSN